MSNADNVLNILVDPESGNIYHVNSHIQMYFGVAAEKLRGMNLSQIFQETVEAIAAIVPRTGQLHEITLHLRDATLVASDVQAYASLMRIENRTMLFLCIIGPQQPVSPPTAAIVA